MFEVKQIYASGEERVIYRRYSLFEAIFDVFQLHGIADVAIDVLDEQDLTDRKLRVIVY